MKTNKTLRSTMRVHSLSTVIIVACLSGVFPALGFAQPKQASPASASSAAVARLPDGANAVLTIDVEKLIASPWGKQNKLQSKLTSGYADRPLPVPANAKRVAVGALVNPVGMDAVWQAAVIELPGAPRLEPMLRAQGGYLDEIGGKQAAWTPNDVFFLALDGHTLGVARPGQRQLVHRWVAGQTERGGASAYVTMALARASDDAVAVFAIDLNDAIGRMAINYALDMGQLPSLEKIEKDQDKLLTALASVRGATISVSASDKLDATCAIDFEQDVSALGAQAEALMKDVLSLAGAYEPDMEKWEFKIAGKRIVGRREINEQGLSRVLAILAPPHVSDEAVAAEASSNESTAPSSATAAAQASQQYYRAVSKKLDLIEPKFTPTATAGSLQAHSRAIQQLPMLNVDPALLEWGNSVSDAFSRAAQELALGQQKAKIASQNVASPTAYTTDSPKGGGNSTAETRAAYRNAQQQRRAVGQTERGAAAEKAFGILNQVLPSRGKVRADMTQKYGVEF
jgi:hypothetical protein